MSVLLEGGPTLAGAFLADGLVDRVVGYVAPALLGDGPPASGGAGVGTIKDAVRLRLDDVDAVRRRRPAGPAAGPAEGGPECSPASSRSSARWSRWEDLRDAARLTVKGPTVTSDARHGDSISVNGVCLTVVDNQGGTFTADVMRESLQRSSLGALRVGSPVNLERAVRVSDRLGGHVVQGHVDGTGTLLEVRPDEHWTVVRVAAARRASAATSWRRARSPSTASR